MKLKNILVCFIAILLFQSCSDKAVDQNPIDLKGYSDLLSEKIKSRKELDKEIAAIRQTMSKLDTSRKKAIRVVTLDTIATDGFEKYLTVQGSVLAGDVVNAVPEMSGRLLNIFVKEGDRVRKGQMIAKLDGESADKQLDELQTSLDLATAVFERQDRLWKQNIGSEMQYLEAKANKERLEKTISTVKFQQSKTGVYAPISGIVNKEFMDRGEVVPAGMAIVEIINDRNVKISADLPERYLNVVKRGDYVDIRIPALEKNIKSRISLLGRTIDPANRTFKIEIDLKNYNGTLKPNLLAEVKVKQKAIKDVVIIPTELVQEEISGQLYVYVASESEDKMIAKKQYVEMGDSFEGTVVITEGLTMGETIIIDGARLVKDGEVIKTKS